jgi:hypothetical protein
VLRSDAWHTWGGIWTMAPLYHLFAAAVFGLLGPHLLPLQLVQCVLDSGAAVLVAGLGRGLVGTRGAAAGVAYALYWPAIEFPSSTLTENLHTVLLVAGLSAVGLAARGRRWSALGGGLLGLSALSRTVSAAFLPIAAYWTLRRTGSRLSAAAVLGAGALAILPWTARNVFVVGDPVLIETVSVFNLWTDNALVEPSRYAVQERQIHRQPTPSAQRALALEYAWRGVARDPGGFVRKVRANFAHFVRPEGLYQLLVVERPVPPWRHAAELILDDALLVAGAFLFVVWIVASPPSPLRSLLLSWTVYYLVMVVVVFHNEIRYRSAIVPVLFAGAAAGAVALVSPAARRRGSLRLGVLLGTVLAVLMVGPYVPGAVRAVQAAWALRPVRAAVAAGDIGRAERAALEAAQRDPHSPRPWLTYASWLAWADRPAEAAEAYRRAEMRRPEHLPAVIALARLLDELRSEDAPRYRDEAQRLARKADPWIALEAAWRALPPPRADEIRLGRDDYGAVRGFLQSQRADRWTRGRAWLRLRPTRPAASYEISLAMASPPPSPFDRPTVRARASGGSWVELTLAPEARPYRLQGAAGPGGVVVVEIVAPTWNRPGQPAEMGVRVDGMTVVPIR